LLTAFDIQVLYRSDMHQVTIRASLTSDTPGTDGDTSRIAAGQDPVYHSAPGPIRGETTLNHGCCERCGT
jgi:hypothetical protein